ncbi:hypothetical protein PF003_g16322 [Phytophthora fragariae]|nr:hypothetical protein PF003_g16322 [Phytophthora fragariae]
MSTDDATPDPGSCRSLGQEDVLTRQDPTSDTQSDGDSSDLYDLGQANQPVVTSGGNQGGNQLDTWCGSADSTYGGVERDLDPAVSHDLVGDELGRGVPLNYKKRQGSDQASGQVASSDDSSADGVVDKQVCCPDSGDLRAEDVEAKMVVLPEVMSATEEMTFNDIHAGDPTINTAGQIGHLQLIWRNQHVTIDKGCTLPLAARGIASDVNEGVAKGGDKILGRSLPVSRPNPK